MSCDPDLYGHDGRVNGVSVYNRDNIERVRRDEADARAREEAAEQRMQEEDAARRIAQLKGEKVAPLPEQTEATVDEDPERRRRDQDYTTRDRKRRRLRGEDDTDRDIRYARQETEAGRKATQSLVKSSERDAPLQDHAGNIQLFAAPDEKAIRAVQKNEEAEAEKAKKRKREEDQVTMRFSNAAGFQNGMQKPWYAAAAAATLEPPSRATRNELMLAELKGKDVWGNEDPSRKERERSRISSSDPFAAMQQAQKQLKQSTKDRERWQKDQQQQLDDLKRRQKRDKEPRRRDDDGDSLNGFSLDAPTERERRERSEGRRRHRHHHRRSGHRSRSREGERRHRHRSHSRSRERGSERHGGGRSRHCGGDSR